MLEDLVEETKDQSDQINTLQIEMRLLKQRITIYSAVAAAVGGIMTPVILYYVLGIQ